MHFVTWVPWVVGFGLALRYVDGLARWTVFGLTVGFGAVTHIVWELMEYVAFIRTNPDELEGAYRDTMGDLTLSLAGSITGAALCATALWTLGRPVAVDPPGRSGDSDPLIRAGRDRRPRRAPASADVQVKRAALAALAKRLSTWGL